MSFSIEMDYIKLILCPTYLTEILFESFMSLTELHSISLAAYYIIYYSLFSITTNTKTHIIIHTHAKQDPYKLG